MGATGDKKALARFWALVLIASIAILAVPFIAHKGWFNSDAIGLAALLLGSVATLTLWLWGRHEEGWFGLKYWLIGNVFAVFAILWDFLRPGSAVGVVLDVVPWIFWLTAMWKFSRSQDDSDEK
jgi:hypothetical protein